MAVHLLAGHGIDIDHIGVIIYRECALSADCYLRFRSQHIAAYCLSAGEFNGAALLAADNYRDVVRIADDPAILAV